mgnify:CR=1 FL=1
MSNDEQLKQWDENHKPYQAMKKALDSLNGVPAGDAKVDYAYLVLREAYFALSGMTTADERAYPVR